MKHDLELVRQAKFGDTAAFSKLYECIYQDLYRFALYILKNPHDAEDVVSETVMDAYREIHSLRKTESFQAWIFRILTNKCKQKLKQYLAKTTKLPEDLPCFEGDICESLDVRSAFAALTGEERLIIALHVFGGYSSHEIGMALGLNNNTVRSKQSRALKKMELCLNR